MRENDVAALGTLGFDNGSEASETATPLPVRHHLIRHQIDVIDQDESYARRRCISRNAGGEERQQDRKQAKHGHLALFRSRATGLARMQGGALSRMLGP